MGGLKKVDDVALITIFNNVETCSHVSGFSLVYERSPSKLEIISQVLLFDSMNVKN